MMTTVLGIRILRWSALIFFVAVACQRPLLAQDQGQSQDQSTLRVSVNLVLLDATVKTKDGRIMADLKKDDFEIREDGVAQKMEIFGRDELPLEVALVLDLSDSIGPFMGPLREAATTALGALKPEDQVALFTFATEAELRVPFTTDKSKIAAQFGTFKVGGATNINDGIFVAAKYLLGRRRTGHSRHRDGNDCIGCRFIQFENTGIQPGVDALLCRHGSRIGEHPESHGTNRWGNL